ncbi:predicted protein [Thalassiosira pseudonana CCMP1335]|uniref:UBL3-like ubiquitin domain-containing protein n=1 Tax=Thalassiosira pseudonana TaxID=35128 RepID=B8C0N5_THAPS|nr:predicted protein [Thalassiosira pseudonana CCMP1335]EED93095.1 predicted protein [Thalassiosira pseudonana CCMP1335]
MSTPESASSVDAGETNAANNHAENGVITPADNDESSSINSDKQLDSNGDESKSDSQIDNQNDEKGAPQAQAAPDTSSSSTSSTPPAPSKSSYSSTHPPFIHDPNKITLKFIFANRDGIQVLLDCTPHDTIGEVKGALLSMWPPSVPECTGGDKIRLICMGKGILMPDSKTLEGVDVPVFKTHATPINVSVRPEMRVGGEENGGKGSPKRGGGSGGVGTGGSGAGNAHGSGAGTVSSGCSCVIL